MNWMDIRRKHALPDADSALPGRAEAMPVKDRHAVLGTPLLPPYAAHLEQARDQREDRHAFADGFAETQAVLGCPSLLRRLGAKSPKSPACHAVTVLSLRTVPFAGDVVALVAVERHRRHGGTNTAECHTRGRARNSAAESRWVRRQCERAESRGTGV